MRDTAVFIALYAAALYACIFVSNIFTAASSADELAAAASSGQKLAMVSVCGSLLAVVAVAVYRRAIYGRSCSVMHSKRGFDPVVLLWGLALLVSISIVIDPLLSHLPSPDQNYGRGGWTLLAVVVIAPVAEELLFRGMLTEMLRRHTGTAAAVIVSSVVFALMHLQPAVMIDAFLAGMALCYIYFLTRSIYACILLHMFNNAIAMSMQVLEYQDKTFGEIIDSSSLYFIIYAVALVVAVAGAMHAVTTIGRSGRRDKNTAVR